MENHNTMLTVVESSCPFYKPGDKIYFDGALLNKEKSDAVCMVAVNALYPFVYAARRGGSVKPTLIQCPDCDECVKFTVARLD